MHDSMENHIDENKRIVSIDAFRGFIMLSMLLHTLGLKELAVHPVFGFIYSQLQHASWVGFHFEDIILPSFLFIIGVSMGISDDRRQARGELFSARALHAVKRAIVLFGIGFLLTWIGRGRPFWGPGVLQVLAMSYICAFFFLRFNVRVQAGVFFGLIFLYWFFIYIVFIPEAGRNSYVLSQNLVYLIDDKLTGSADRWGYIYPTITATAVVVYGSIIGKLLIHRSRDRDFMKFVAMLGIIGILSGCALHPVIPVIKRMFTSSYTLLACGIASLLLCLFFWIIDVRGKEKWSKLFVILGMNSLFVYILEGLFGSWLKETGMTLLNPLSGYLGLWITPATEIFRLVVLWSACYWLYRRRIFFKL